MSLDFMKTISELHSRRYLLQVQNLVVSKVPCGFFCGFNIPPNIMHTVNSLKSWGINLTAIVVPSEEAKNLFAEANLPIITLVELLMSNVKFNTVLYTGYWMEYSFSKYFNRYGIDALLLKSSNETEHLFNVYMKNLPNLYSTYEMLADDESKEVFRAYILGRCTERIVDYRFAPEPQYFLEGFLPVEGDIAIDGGAYDGGTSRDFALQGAKVYAFEMSPENYKNCTARAEKYNFVIENIGLSNMEFEDSYSGGGAGARRVRGGGGAGVARFTDLDTYVLKHNLPRVDYIKLDIEGAELDMLHGAAKSIVRWKPKMAISAYHRNEDLWTLVNYVKSLRPDYEFKFRHYRIDATDYLLGDMEREILKHFGLDYLVPSFCETVFYCR